MSIFNNPFMVRITYNPKDKFADLRITCEHKPSDRWPVKYHFVFDIRALLAHDFYSNTNYFEDDINNILKIHGDSNENRVCAKLTFVSESAPAVIFRIPDFKLVEIASQFTNTGSVNIAWLVYASPNCIKYDFSNAQKAVREMASNKLMRRAFCKAISRSFQWIGATEIMFGNDWCKGSFGFTEYRGDKQGICGGFICHENSNQPNSSGTCYRYEIHT